VERRKGRRARDSTSLPTTTLTPAAHPGLDPFPIGSDSLTGSLPADFFARPAEQVAPELVGCLLIRWQEGGRPLWGMVVETEAYCQSEPACHGHRRRSPANETLFGPPGRFYVYLTYGLHHCVNVVTHHDNWASGVLLRAVAIPGEPERMASGPGLLARHFGIDRSFDRRPLHPASGAWLAPRPAGFGEWWAAQARLGRSPLLATTRIGVSQAQELPWRWYLRASRSVSRRARGDRTPRPDQAFRPGSGGSP
jgi:DNA-3-methyladenine glycosylase